MQSTNKEIYRITAARTGKDEQLYKDLGNFIQKELADALKKPKALILRIKGIGHFYLRKKRMERMMALYPPYYEIEGYSDFETEAAFLRFVNKQELYKLFKERLKDYDKYLEVRKEIKKKRDEFNRLYDGPENS